MSASVQLEELVEIVGGGTPSKSMPEYFDGTIPWVTPKDMKFWAIEDSRDHISQEAVDNSATRIVPVGSVLVVIRSGVLKHTLPVGITRCPVAINQDLKAFIPQGRIDSGYLAYFLKSQEAKLLSNVRATTVDNVPLDEFKKLRVPLPSMSEQRRIAAILDRADAIRRKRKQAIALTEQLLRSTFLEMFGDPVTNPKSWPVKPLGELLATEPRIGTLVPASNNPGTLVVRVGELGAYDVQLSRTKRAALPNADLERYGLETGDVLLARAIGSEDHLGKASVLQMHNEPVAFDSHVMRLRFRDQVLDPYVFVQWLKTPGGRARFMTQAGRTAVQFNVNGKQIVKIQIPLPPIAEQRRFRAVFDSVRAIQKSFDMASAAGDACFDALVSRSFSAT